MTHPSINLPDLTAKLESIGFEALTKLLFRRGFVDVIIVNGLLPDNLTPEEIEAWPPHFRITMFEQSADIEGVFDCPIDGLTILNFQE